MAGGARLDSKLRKKWNDQKKRKNLLKETLFLDEMVIAYE